MASLKLTYNSFQEEVPIYKEIIITGTPIADFQWDSGDRIQSLARINIFVGANNSGKSRALRTIFNQTNFSYVTDQITINDIKVLAKKIQSEIDVARGGSTELKTANGILINDRLLSDIEKYEKDFNTYNDQIHLYLNDRVNNISEENLSEMEKISRSSNSIRTANMYNNLINIHKKYAGKISQVKDKNSILLTRVVLR
jgi:AAA15 family ATPase/GTPase